MNNENIVSQVCIHYSLFHNITIYVLCVYTVYIKLYIYESNICIFA